MTVASTAAAPGVNAHRVVRYAARVSVSVRVFVVVAAWCLLAGCGDAPLLMEPRHRLVDTDAADPRAPRPSATLRDERRLVLREVTTAPLLSTDVIVTLRATFSVRQALPHALAGNRRLVLSPRVRLRTGWQSLPGTIQRVERGALGEFVKIDLDLPKMAVGSTVRVAVDGYVPLPESRSLFETPVVDISSASRLEFGMGVLDPARDQGPVAFSVQACVEANCEVVFRETLDPGATADAGWQDRAVALDAYAGTTRSFRFETTHLAVGRDTFSLPVWSNPTLYAPVERAPEDFNVVLLSLDTLRADHLPSYGHPVDTAPFIDAKFGRQGSIFETFVAAATTTGPSHMSLFTSLYPSFHGMTGVVGDRRAPVAAVTLAEALREHGFETGAVTENAALDGARGFARGFNSYAENKDPGVGVGQTGKRLLLPTYGHIEDTFEKARRWMTRQKNKRFFLFLHTYQVHYPYTPPAAYGDLGSEPARGARRDPWLPEDRDPALYDQEIRYVDDQMRSLFGFLAEEGLALNTLFILTSDHGEEFFEHGFAGHGPNLHEEVLHVPLMLVGPGIPRGRRFANPVGHIDLMPTILDLAGAPHPVSVTGRSFAPLLRSERSYASRDVVPLYSEAWYTTSIWRGEPRRSIRVGTRKLIREPTSDGVRYRYFDLARDPREREDLYHEAASEARDLKRLLDEYVAAAASSRAGPGRGRPEMKPPPGDLAIDPDREEKLRALGYLE